MKGRRLKKGRVMFYICCERISSWKAQKNLGRGTTRDTFSPSHELTNHAREKYTVILSDIIPQLIINHCCSSSSSDYGPIYTNVYDHAPIATLRCLGSASAAVNLDSVSKKYLAPNIFLFVFQSRLDSYYVHRYEEISIFRIALNHETWPVKFVDVVSLFLSAPSICSKAGT